MGAIVVACAAIACCGDDDDPGGFYGAGASGAEADAATAGDAGSGGDGGTGARGDGGAAPDVSAVADAASGGDGARDAEPVADGSVTTDAGAATDAANGSDAARPADAGAACFGKVLLILDESASMTEPWDATTRLDATRAAVHAAVTAHAATLRVGALFFPNLACITGLPAPEGGAVLPLSDPMQIDFVAGPDFLAAWTARLASSPPLGIGTPLQEAFDRADVGLGSTAPAGPTRVVLITDGDGNCVAPEPTATPDTRVTAWKAAGIETRAVSLAPADAPQLTAIASAAGVALAQPTTAAELAALVLELLDPECSP